MKPLLRFSIALLALCIMAGAQAQTSDLSVSFIIPTNGQTVVTPMTMRVLAFESSNLIVSAEYFVDGQSLGVVSNRLVTLSTGVSQSNPQFITFWVPTPGDYVLTAKVADDQGNTAMSDSVNVTIIPAPVVTVEATELTASPSGPGVFTITRSGNSNSDLSIQCFLLGTAQDGVDYAMVSNSIIIPARQSSTDVDIDPLTFAPGNTKIVTLKLWNYQIPGGGGPGPVPLVLPLYPPYFVGSEGEATIYITPNERNRHKPSVKLIQPRGKQRLVPFGSAIAITADTFDRDTFVAKVEFFDGVTKLGETLNPATPPPGQHVQFNFNWTNASVGPHVLRVRATDSQNATQVSGPARIKVLPAP